MQPEILVQELCSISSFQVPQSFAQINNHHQTPTLCHSLLTHLNRPTDLRGNRALYTGSALPCRRQPGYLERAAI